MGTEPKVPFGQAIREWDREAVKPYLAEAERQRQEVLQRFPIADWPQLPLDRYALGVEDTDTFCRWMEFKATNMGSIRGGTAKKHLIYRKTDGTGWYYVDHNAYPNVEAAWEAVRANFVEAFELARVGRWAAFGDLYPLNLALTLSGKAVYTYFPNELIPIYSQTAQQHFYALLGGVGDLPSGVPGSRRLLEVARERAEFAGWSPAEIERFLYTWADPRETHRVFKIAPGHDGFLWDDCRANGYIRVGGDAVGDLRNFGSSEEFRAAFAQAYGQEYKGNQSTISEKAAEVWSLLDLGPGDLIVANRGTSHVLAIGKVVDPGYVYRADLGENPHTVSVAWDESQERDIDTIGRWAFKTVAPVSMAEYNRILAGKTVPSGGPRPPTIGPVAAPAAEPIWGEIESAILRKGQVILYGPPGTGKTYHARRFAVWWLRKRAGDPSPTRPMADDRSFREAETSLSTAQAERRTWWVVANRSEWSWDQLFTDGTVEYRYSRLKANYARLHLGDLVIGYQANPEKRIMALGRIKAGLHETPDGQQITIEALARVPNGVSWDELVADPILSASEPVRFRNQGTLFALTREEAVRVLALLSERDPNLSIQDLGDDEEIGPLTRVTFHPSYTYEDFVEGYKPVANGTGQLELRLELGIFRRVCDAARAKPSQTFLLVIDEINRGNIPKIFGELITLIETDKRGMTVVLPQSRESFSVPPNLFILGTMNTADRSIKLLDAALRRRFAFIELMPDPSPLEGARIGGLDLAQFLIGLNQRIAKKQGREKQIGHSYFMRDGLAVGDAQEFSARLRLEILPLLQEYAYEDYGELASYLGTKVVDVDAQRFRPEYFANPDALIDALTEVYGQAAAGDFAEPGA